MALVWTNERSWRRRSIVASCFVSRMSFSVRSGLCFVWISGLPNASCRRVDANRFKMHVSAQCPSWGEMCRNVIPSRDRRSGSTLSSGGLPAIYHYRLGCDAAARSAAAALRYGSSTSSGLELPALQQPLIALLYGLLLYHTGTYKHVRTNDTVVSPEDKKNKIKKRHRRILTPWRLYGDLYRSAEIFNTEDCSIYVQHDNCAPP